MPSKVTDKLLKFKWPLLVPTHNGTPPYGYTRTNEMWIPTPETLDALEVAKDLLANGLSTRDCTDWLTEHTGTSISHQGFLKRIKRDNKLYQGWEDVRPTEITEWTSSSEEYGDGTLYYPFSKPKAKPQRNGRAKRSALLRGKSLEEKEVIKKTHNIQEANKILTRNKNQLKGLLKEASNDTVKKLIPDTIVKEFIEEEAALEVIAEQAQEIIFEPNKGPQTNFLASTEDVVFYGGAKGGGKSYALIADPLRYCVFPTFRSLILRRTMPELRDMIRHTQLLYPRVFPGAKYLKTEKTWEFPNGATLEFGYCETEEDAERYRGQSFHWVGIDELPQYAHRGPFDALMSCLRSVDSHIPTQMRCTGNPGNIGSGWVKREFIDPAAPNARFFKEAEITDPRNNQKRIVRKSFKYIPATVYDNPYLVQDDNYLAALALLPAVKRKQMLEGNWDVIDAGAFPEFDRSIHVIPPFSIPDNWYTFRAADWGFSSPFCVLWIATDFDENMYIFKEWYDQGVYDDTWAETIASTEKEEKIYCGHAVIDGSVSTSRGSRAKDSLEVINKILGRNRLVKFKKADRSPGSRKEGKLAVHRMLALKETGRELSNGEKETAPSLFIFDNCTDLVRTLPALLTDPNDSEIVYKKNAEDHAYDALQYGIRSHKTNTRRRYAAMDNIKTNRPQPADPVFGY